MTFKNLDEYLKSKDVINVLHIKRWKSLRYTVNDKLFALLSFSPKGQPIITLKCRSSEIEKNRAAYPKIIVPAFELEPSHWSSVYFLQTIPDDYIKNMIDDSYALIAAQTQEMKIAPSGDANAKYNQVGVEFNFNLIRESDLLKVNFYQDQQMKDNDIDLKKESVIENENIQKKESAATKN